MIDSAGQDLLNQQVHIGTCDAGTQTNGIDHRRPLESDPDLGLSGPGVYHEPNVTLFGDNHGSQADSLALTLFRPSQHDDPQIEQLTVDQGLQEVLLGEHTHLIEEINQENILLRSQRDDLLYQCAGLESDLSTSFVEKMDLEEELKSAEKTIEKGRALYERSEAEWKETHSKLENMTRLFEANTENEKFVEMLEQQKLLDEENTWILGQLQMKTEDNRYFAVQREAVVRATEYDRVCAMTAEIENLRQRLSTFQAQLAESDTAKLRLSAELQQERINHRATRKAIESKYKMGSSPSHLQQTAYAGGSVPQKPSKFTPTYTIASQAPLPKAGTSSPSYSEQNSEYIFGAVGDTPKEYGTRSKSKFSFGDNTVPESPRSKPKFSFGENIIPESTRSKSKFSFEDNTIPESTLSATGATTGAAPRKDFNFTFGGTADHHSSLSGYGNTTGSELPNDSTSSANIFAATTFSADSQQTASPPSPGNPNVPLFKAEPPRYFDEYHHGSRAHVEHSHDQYFPSGALYTNNNSPANIFLTSAFSTDGEQTASPPSPGSPNVFLFQAESPQYFDEFYNGNQAHKEHSHDQYSSAGATYTNSKLFTDATDKVDLFGGWGLDVTAENKAPYNFAQSADVYNNQNAKKGAKKPLASDFFDEDPVEAEVEANTMVAPATETTTGVKVPTSSAEADPSPNSHIEDSTNHNAGAGDTVQAGESNEVKEAGEGNNLPPPTSTPSTPPSASKEKANPSKQPKSKGKTSNRALLRKAAKERKKAPMGEADWSGSS